MFPELVNPFSWWQWAVLAAVPPAIVALYFLKLKRRPVEVPSTYLWHKSIEDLHVNSIWQRLRRNLLLFLQLLVLLLVILALLRPGWRSEKLPGKRFIFLVDNSASMQATDEKPSRLEAAKREAEKLVEKMEPGDVAMVVSFNQTAKIEQMFTDSRRRLARALAGIKPSAGATSLLEALKVASGLANPGRSGTDPTDYQVAEPMPATLYIFSDGKFPDVADFALGYLDPVYRPIGSPEAGNVGIVAMSVRRHESRPELLQVFARLQNFGHQPAVVDAELFWNDRQINVDRFEIPPEAAQTLVHDLGNVEPGMLRLRLATGDDLPLDDEAWVAVNVPRRAKVLLVTRGNEYLEKELGTASNQEIAAMEVRPPAFLAGEGYGRQAAIGAYDLVIYDRCRPKEMPQANTLFLGEIPPLAGWKRHAEVAAPQIFDTDPSHPLLQWIDMRNVLVADATPLDVPPGGKVLLDSHRGPLFVVAPREGFEDAVLGFVLVDLRRGPDGSERRYVGTDWPIRVSFPIFVRNVLEHLGGAGPGGDERSVHPGEQVAVESPAPGKPLVVRKPSGATVELREANLGRFSFTDTSELGVYEAAIEGKPVQRFAVNLFQPIESDVRTRAEIKIGRVPVQGQATAGASRRETWKVLLLGGLIVLVLEWYIYSRRVSM